MPAANIWRPVLGLVLAAALTGGCENEASLANRSVTHHSEADPTPAGGTAPPSEETDASVALLLREMGMSTVYVMAGEDRLHAGLGVLDARGLRPAPVSPSSPLVSNISGNGHTILIGGTVEEGTGFRTDGVFRLIDNKLETLVSPEKGYYGPTVGPDGTIAAITSDGDIFVRSSQQGRWTRDTRLSQQALSSLSFDDEGNAFTIVNPNQGAAFLVELPRRGSVRRIARVGCSALPLHAPSNRWIAVSLPVQAAEPECERSRARIVDTATGVVTVLPSGWDPVAWSSNSQTLLLSRGNSLTAWRVTSRKPVAHVDVGVHVWMAAGAYG